MTQSEPKAAKQRIDQILADRGLAESRAKAQAYIMAGLVTVAGKKIDKPGHKIASDSAIELKGKDHPWVSRGGIKLDHALRYFDIDVTGMTAMDVGSSTGGFTDVLLRACAKHVVAVDVGRGQFHLALAGDNRVTSLEAQDARTLTADMLGEAPSLLVCDASFISLEKLLAVPLFLAAERAEFVGLFKPQFQVGREHVGKGGLVTDIEISDRAAEAFALWMERQGWPIRAWTDSPITGGDGNAERLFHAVKA
eukprot:TRINITY_DN24117_c0_g1_i1.p1 TRINITY_DN24117_c0_g1~~TRINITY_DN24117_c0_g1_i1.p1  ORF type:complete len:252 (+),score=40.54 TRINITY_DN24117_c0_g1_i1:56-811(+)